MSKFLKIPISPLMGSSILNYIKVILSNKVDFKFYLHVFLTFLVVLLISPFQLIDKIKNNTVKRRLLSISALNTSKKYRLITRAKKYLDDIKI